MNNFTCVTERILILNILTAWKNQFFSKTHEKWFDEKYQLVYDKLQQLDLKTVTRDIVDDIICTIGIRKYDHNWLYATCNGCDTCVSEYIQIQNKYSVVQLCESCSKKIALLWDS